MRAPGSNAEKNARARRAIGRYCARGMKIRSECQIVKQPSISDVRIKCDGTSVCQRMKSCGAFRRGYSRVAVPQATSPSEIEEFRDDNERVIPTRPPLIADPKLVTIVPTKSDECCTVSYRNRGNALALEERTEDEIRIQLGVDG
jgi:hypothetical protein